MSLSIAHYIERSEPCATNWSAPPYASKRS